MIHERHRQTDGQTQDRALHYSTSRGKHRRISRQVPHNVRFRTNLKSKASSRRHGNACKLHKEFTQWHQKTPYLYTFPIKSRFTYLKVGRRLEECVNHLLANRPVHNISWSQNTIFEKFGHTIYGWVKPATFDILAYYDQ